MQLIVSPTILAFHSAHGRNLQPDGRLNHNLLTALGLAAVGSG